jgi:hypothetical protein
VPIFVFGVMFMLFMTPSEDTTTAEAVMQAGKYILAMMIIIALPLIFYLYEIRECLAEDSESVPAENLTDPT